MGPSLWDPLMGPLYGILSMGPPPSLMRGWGGGGGGERDFTLITLITLITC
jgi:hypothetical protein